MAVAERVDSIELISADSMQVYRGMDIGTAKPTAAEQGRVRHHLIDVADPDDDYTLSRYVAAVDVAVADIASRDGIPVLVGGTGLYVRGAVDDFEIPGQFPEVRAELDAELDLASLYGRLAELDPVAAARMEPTNRRRVVRALEVTLGSGRPFSSWGPGMDQYPEIATHQVACDRPRPSLDTRIHERYDQQLIDGFVDEVRALADRPGGICRTARQALGYREILEHVEGGKPLDMVIDMAKQRTRRFARRQQRWFRRDPRIQWSDLDERGLDGLADELVAMITKT